MFAVDLSGSMEPIPGTVGLSAKLLSGDFDEPNQSGFRTRCVRFEPGGKTFEPYVHAYWEEVYLAEGSLTSTDDGVTLTAPAYVIRPPGTSHGPFISHDGCILLEIQYFADRKAGPTGFLDPKAP